MEWREQAEAAEELQDWDTAITLVSAHAMCYGDSEEHDSHLWHMGLLFRAQRLTELMELALTDIHARRVLNRSLGRCGMESALRDRAGAGAADALYVLVRRQCETGRTQEARRTAHEIEPAGGYAHRMVASYQD
ncbi:MAG TPA: hypothetical protein VN520_06960 [Streptomyces sp.]|uniref:hypothetical protein n=1 Tax=Streptomyces sp. TaxID=1931 RepID=UPI002C09BDD7|nr:hypothetical protein [Streptomyces sp.]HWU06120.1 hypothetical protein [Streptomyces sp.]